MSAAVPSSSDWMKLACLGDTSADLIRKPFAPRAFDEATGAVALWIGEDRTGVLAAGLVRSPPANNLGERLAADNSVARGQLQSGLHHDFVGRDVAGAIAQVELDLGASCHSTAVQIC